MFQDDAAEFRLLGAFIDNPDAIRKATDAMFTGVRLAVFKAMKESLPVYRTITTEGVENFLGKPLPQEIEMARGSAPDPLIDRLAQLALRRQLVTKQDAINRLLGRGDFITHYDLAKTLQIEPIVQSDDTGLEEGIVSFVTEFKRKRAGEYKFIKTGLNFLDHMLGGEWSPKSLTVIMAQAGGGKTALLLTSALNMARLAEPIPSLILSLEMPKDKLINRLVANIASLDGRAIKSGEVAESELVKIDEALTVIPKFPVYVYDKQGATIDECLYQIKQHYDLYKIKVVFVDYLQIIGHAIEDTQHEVLGYITQQLRNMAVNLNIAIVLLSQQNRQHEGLNSVLGSGRVGQIADSVFEIKMDQTTGTDSLRNCEFIFYKNREGPLGRCNAVFRPKYLRFEND